MAALGRRRATAAAVGVAVLVALALRFAVLGDRIFHWDEARVGYWILQYQATGDWQYRAIVHGPFLFHVNDFLFGVFGTSDAVARAPVALVGGLVPATAWLFRDRLEDVEVVALAALLAANPVLVYYSRFMRNDVLVAAFSLAALGFAVRAMDSRRGGYVVAAGACLGLAFTAKENALVYVAMFGGASALLLDERLFTARERETTWTSALYDELRRAGSGVVSWWRPLLGALGVFFAVVVFFYAPRPELSQALTSPTRLPNVVAAGSLGAWTEFWSTWGMGGSVSREHSYIAFLVDAVKTLGAASLMLVAAGVLGFLGERYVADDPRDVVQFAAYWGVASIVIYPAITDISGHWSVVHAVVPLAIPAAVGVRLVADKGLAGYRDGDWVTVALAAVVLLAAAGQMGAVTAETSFVMPQDEDNELVQFGQPGSDMRPTLNAMDRVASANEGTDVLYYGDHFHVPGEYEKSEPGGVAGTNWFQRLPLPWYTERADAKTDSTLRLEEPSSTDVTTRSQSIAGTEAPVVITRAKHYAKVAPLLEDRGYQSWTYELTSTNTHIVVFVNTSATGYEQG